MDSAQEGSNIITELFIAAWRVTMLGMRQPTCIIAALAIASVLAAQIGIADAYGDDSQQANIVADKSISPESSKETSQETVGDATSLDGSD